MPHPRTFRYALIGLVALIGLTLLSSWQQERLAWPTAFTRSISYGSSASIAHPELGVQASVLSELYEQHRIHLLEKYEPLADERELGYRSVADPVNRGNGTDLFAHVDRLRSFVERSFPLSSSYRRPLLDTVERLRWHLPPIRPSVPHPSAAAASPNFCRSSSSSPTLPPDLIFPRIIHTTDKSTSPSDLPGLFAHWARIHKPDDGWAVRVWDDLAIERFFTGVFEGDEGDGATLGGSEAGKDAFGIVYEWNLLRQPVFKADIFRYLKLLLDGGIYTDSDTAPVAPAESWGHSYESIISPELGAVRTILRTANPSFASALPSSSHNNTTCPSNVLSPPHSPFYDDPRSYRTPINDPGIQLVVGIEVDAVSLNMGDDWREFGMSRKLQVCQWTLMAKPFHPVFLDVLDNIFAMAKRDRERLQSGEITEQDLPSALEFTGPGPFTDAVMRYLVLQYGIMPRDLIGRTTSIRIGDVLILPTYSFSQPPPQLAHADTGAVHHEYKGRWRAQEPGATDV